jgi:hypothetical protein
VSVHGNKLFTHRHNLFGFTFVQMHVSDVAYVFEWTYRYEAFVKSVQMHQPNVLRGEVPVE